MPRSCYPCLAPRPAARLAPSAAVFGLVCLAFGILGSGPFAAPALAQPGGPSNVSVATVERRTFQIRVEALGWIEAVRATNVSAQVPGLVAEVLVEEGDRVEEGDVLLRLETLSRQIRKRRAEAELALDEQQLAEYRAGSRREDILEARASVGDAVAQLDEARLDRERIEALRGSDSVSEDEISSAQAVERSREAIRDQRQAILERLEAGPRPEVIARAEQSVAIRKAELDEIDDEIRKATIRAPFSGVVTEKLVEVGRYVNSGEALFSLVQTDPVRARLAVSEGDLRNLEVGQSATIGIAVAPDQRFQGTIRAIIPRGDPAAKTFPVTVRLDNENGMLLPGMSVKAFFDTMTKDGVLTVPSDAIAESPIGRVVFVVRDGKAERVPVRPGLTEKGLVVVEGEIEEGESVVVLGNETLRPGSPVRVVPRDVSAKNRGGERETGSTGGGQRP